MKYVTDIYGNNPLMYALKRKNYEVLNILLDFFIKNPEFIKSLRFIEFIALLELSPS
jgi:ankyrin repeat protein